jgi:hypothetical protein
VFGGIQVSVDEEIFEEDISQEEALRIIERDYSDILQLPPVHITQAYIKPDLPPAQRTLFINLSGLSDEPISQNLHGNIGGVVAFGNIYDPSLCDFEESEPEDCLDFFDLAKPKTRALRLEYRKRYDSDGDR